MSHGMTAERLGQELFSLSAVEAEQHGEDPKNLLTYKAAAMINAQAAEIERLTRERDDLAFIAREQEDAHVAANLRCAGIIEAAEARLAALSAPVGDGEVDKLATMLRRYGERSGDECGKQFIDGSDMIRRLASSLARVREAAIQIWHDGASWGATGRTKCPTDDDIGTKFLAAINQPGERG